MSSGDPVQPETTFNYGVGYRYHAATLTGSANAWYSTWNNHIVSSVDPNDPTLSIDRNVGDVQLYGLDLEMGWRATDDLTIYASNAFTKSALQANYYVSASNGLSEPLPVKGKQLVLTPEEAFALRGEYKIGDVTLGLDAKYTGSRFVDDINSMALSGYTVADFDVEYKFMIANIKSALQFNIYNLFAASYFNRASTSGNYTPVVTPSYTISAANANGPTNYGPYVYTGAPTTFYLTLKAAF